MLYQYGFYGKAGATLTTGTIQFPVAFSGQPYSVNMTLFNTVGNATFAVNSTATTGFVFHCSLANQNGIFWTAIGK